MKKQPINNVRYVVKDVYHPRERGRKLRKSTKSSGYFSRAGWVPNKFNIKPRRLPFGVRRVAAFGALAIFLAVFAYGGYLWSYKDDGMRSISNIYENFKSAAENMVLLNTDAAREFLENIEIEVKGIDGRTKLLNAAPVLSEVPRAVGNIAELTTLMNLLNSDVESLKTNGFNMLFSETGQGITSILKNTQANIVKIENLVRELKNAASKFGLASTTIAGDYLALDVSLTRGSDFINGILNLLDSGEDKRLIVFFENPSEIRPGGGFLGSYAELVLGGGRVKQINVNDVYYPVRFSDFKIVPPKQLQAIVGSWNTQDANWFFDFAMSAEKTLDFLEASDIYEGKHMAGAVAINVKVIEDILPLIGEIEVPEYGLTLTSKNFLREVQEEVEVGRDKKPGQNPKKILNIITPILMERLSNLDDNDKLQLAQIFAKRAINKDIKFYFRDKTLQDFAEEYLVAGRVFKIPTGFSGDYLAVVNANVAGGKTDVFVRQSIDLTSHIDSAGAVVNKLSIERAHEGYGEREWWYRATNQNYIKVFAPTGAKLESLSGNTSKNVTPLVDYSIADYKVDEDLSYVEDTRRFLTEFETSEFKELGKTSWGTWFSVQAGAERTLELQYVNPKRVRAYDGAKYIFVLDKQSGVESEFKYSIATPEGFVWAESGTSIFEYSTREIPARLTIELTLREE
ncbi:MAG: DUF4012 domain-containing protein [Candidatus Colwellbacteria bacterium]|nr:DUF4012 domain-containing protein [Candidatus Colwellbacteria bacterium]